MSDLANTVNDLADRVSEQAAELRAKDAMIERLRAGYEAIKRATIEGRVCDDVAWFDTITTLHDYCDMMLIGGFAPHSDG